MIETNKNNKILSPGDCQIEMILLTSYNGFQVDITHQTAEIVINESVDYSCISGYIQVVDNLNLIRNVPLIGNEYVTVSFVTPSRPQKIYKKFFCYKIDARIESDTNKGIVSYRLHFVSEEFVTSAKKKISLSFRDKKYNEMASIIFSNYFGSGKRLFAQPTIEKKNLVLPYMSPINAMNLIAVKSMAENIKDVSYFFYEDLDGFYFSNINYFAKNMSPTITYTWYRSNLSEDRDATNLKNIEKEFYRIETYDVVSTNNTINNVRNGLFASSLLLHDCTFKTVSSYQFKYNDDFLNLNTITGIGTLPRKNDNFSDYTMSHYRMYPCQSYAYDNIELNDSFDKGTLNRNSHIKQMENGKLSILVAGDSQRRVGELVNVNIPSAQPRTETEEDFDPYLSGKYIITQITHMVSKFYYKMRLQLERDSLPLQYPEQKDLEVL